MPFSEIIVYLLKFYIPAIWSIVFRAVAFGYKSKRRVVMSLLLYTAYVMIIPAILINLIGYGQYTHFAGYVMTLGGLVVLLFSTDSPSKTIFLQLAQGGVVTILSVILNCMRTIMSFSYETLLILLAICSPILFFIALKFFAKPLRFIIDNLPDKMWSHLLLPILTLVVVTYLPIYPPMTFSNHPIFCTLMMIAVELTFYLYLFMMYQNIRRLNVLKNVEVTNKLWEAEVENYKTYCEIAKTNRHDLRHHDAILVEYLENGDVESALEYLKEHSGSIEKSNITEFCEEPTINAILRLFDRKARVDGINFFASASISQALPMSKPELGGLVSNLLENAFAAAKACEQNKKFVTFDVKTHDNKFLLEIKNSVNDKTEFRNGLPISKKPGGGTGTVSIANAVKAYEGIVNFSQEENEFTSRILIPLEK